MSAGAATGFTLSAPSDGRVVACGPLTFATARLARSAGLALLEGGPGAPLEIDCSGLGASDSAGLAVMLDWLAAAKRAGRSLRFAQLPRQLAALARISDVEQLLTRGV